jgi:hypothetical protein
MDQIWPLMVAVMGANLLTACFIWGMMRARHIFQGDPVDRLTVLAILVPMFYLAAGFYLYG